MAASRTKILFRTIFTTSASRLGLTAASSCPSFATRTRKVSRSRARHCRLRDKSARRKIEDRRFAGRHVYDFKRRRLRLALEHAHFESAAKRNSRHAQNHGATGGGERQSGSAPDDVSRTQLRSPRYRWERSRHVPDQSKGMH